MFDSSEAPERAHQRVFGCPAQAIASAPGRVNLIGEHVDYHDGCVLPIAIQLRTTVSAALNGTGQVTALSHGEGRVEFPSDAAEPPPEDWSRYIRGVLAELRQRGARIPGATLWIQSDLPAGGGLSSSAALCVATTMALASLSGEPLDPLEVAKLCRRAEHRFAGTPCGIMDPYASCFGRAGHALHLDCRALTHRHVPLPPGPVRLLAAPSGVRHALSDGAYEDRQRAGLRAATALAGQGRTLRDVPAAALEPAYARGAIDNEALRRARHVLSEMTRVEKAVAALESGDWQRFGWLLNESHRSLCEDYEVSCDEVEEIISILSTTPGVLGARMVGGGFGGVVLALVEESAQRAACDALLADYYLPRRRAERPFELTSADGAWVRLVRR